MDKKKVVWSEGMFLSPQHFQQQERYLEGFVKNYRDLMIPNRFGLAELELDVALNNIGKVGIKRAKGLFPPDGTPFDVQNGLALEVPSGTNDKLVYLALLFTVRGWLISVARKINTVVITASIIMCLIPAGIIAKPSSLNWPS